MVLIMTRMKHSTLIVLSLLAVITFRLQGQDLDGILEQHYRASAQEKMANIETMVTHGKSIFSSVDLESPFILYQARPDKVRVESEYQGFRVIQTYDGHKGWIFAPGMGIEEPKEITGEELETLLNQADFENPLWNYEARDRSLELISEPGKTSVHQLKLTMADGDVIYFLIDRQSHLITSYITRQVMGGTENEIEVILDNYRSVKGIPVSHKIATKMNGQVVTTIRLDKVEFNRKLDLSLFEKPVGEDE